MGVCLSGIPIALEEPRLCGALPEGRVDPAAGPVAPLRPHLLDPDFWEKTLQNWQPDFLAVGTMAVFTIYLRRAGRPSRSPSARRTDATGSSG